MGLQDMPLPESLHSAIADLWHISMGTEEKAVQSAAFRCLESTCTDIYLSIDGSRLFQKPSTMARPNELQSALLNFFRWNGAPWHAGHVPNANEAALRLHRAFLSSQVNRTFLVPLDRLLLRDESAHHYRAIESIEFGPNEIALLTSAELARRTPQDGLKRFGSGYEFPEERLDDRYWLITTVQEDAGAVWERIWLRIIYESMDDIGRVPVFRSTFPPKIEEALLVLLLSFVKRPDQITWAPFAIPWIYSLTDDPFAEPQRAPDPSALSWSIVGEPGEEFEVPDRPEVIAITDRKIDALQQRWHKLRTVLEKSDSERASFHPLTAHFFVKAFFDEGIDDIIANISCIEATLQLPGERTRKNLMKRYHCLVNDEVSCQWLDSAYRLRNMYLHSLEDPKATISFGDLARARLSVVKAIDAYLDLASLYTDLNRTALLRSLNVKRAV